MNWSIIILIIQIILFISVIFLTCGIKKLINDLLNINRILEENTQVLNNHGNRLNDLELPDCDACGEKCRGAKVLVGNPMLKKYRCWQCQTKLDYESALEEESKRLAKWRYLNE